MSEDEFVVLAEHAGLVDAFDGSADRECVERRQLLRWLEYEGAALFYDRMLAPPSADGNGSDDGEKASIAHAVLDRMIEKQWLTPLASDHVHEGLQGDGSEPSQLYLLRMSTTDAYRIYIEKDAESTVSSRSWSGRSLLDAMRHEQNATATTPSNSSATSSQDDHTVPDVVRQRRIREKMWQDCFPTCSESCKQLFFSFTSPTVVLYASLGLNLIGNGISSVPAFSRELRSMQISHEDRTVVIGFLARAFPTE